MQILRLADFGRCLRVFISWEFKLPSWTFLLGRGPPKNCKNDLTIKLDGNWSSFQLANSAPPLSVTDSAIAPSARMQSLWSESTPHENQNSQCSQKINGKATRNTPSNFWKLRGARLNKKTNEGHLPHEAYALLVCSRSFLNFRICSCVCLAGAQIASILQ